MDILRIEIFVIKQKTAYEIAYRLVGSEKCIRDITRTVHDGSHPGYSEAISKKLSAIKLAGANGGWTDAQYKGAIEKLLAVERAGLRTGKTVLNKNSVPPICG